MLKNILFIGCGGSGGMTLRYAMDQIRADLKARTGRDVVPQKWQFVHIDAPATEEGLGRGQLRVVTDYNSGARVVGSYQSLSSALSYENLNDALMQTAASKSGGPNRLSEAVKIGSTAPRYVGRLDQLNQVPLTDGAGAVRLLGRTLVLNRIGEVVKAIRNAHQRMNGNDAAQEGADIADKCPELALDPNNTANAQTMIFISGSMAGGTGASILLDVALAAKAAIPNSQTSVFGFMPDTFTNLAVGITANHTGNSIAMATELMAFMATSTARSVQEDRALFETLGIAGNVGGGNNAPIDRFYPIGLAQGTGGVVSHQNADPSSVYRRCGRGLARLVMSTKAFNDYISYTLANPRQQPVDPQFLGWGSDDRRSPWASFGYASLSMGRDRFREYAAQRVARVAVDTLVSGHATPDDPTPADQQLRRRVDVRLATCLQDIGVPYFDDSQGNIDRPTLAKGWLSQVISDMVQPLVQDFRGRLAKHIPALVGDDTAQTREWLTRIGLVNRDATVRADFDAISRDLDVEVRQKLIPFVAGLQERILDVVRCGIADFGLDYGQELIQRIAGDSLKPLQGELTGLGRYTTGFNLEMPTLNSVHQQLQVNGRAKVLAGLGQVTQTAVDQGIASQLQNNIAGMAATRLADVMASMLTDFLKPLRDELNVELLQLRNARKLQPKNTGVEVFYTDYYQNWPEEGRVPSRFEQAHNEEVLTAPKDFPQIYQTQLRRQFDREPDWQSAQKHFVVATITGQWDTRGGEQAPNDLLTVTRSWKPSALAEPGEESQAAKFSLRTTTKNIVDRALKYIDRKDGAFHGFISQDINGFLTDATANSVETSDREKLVIDKFMTVMNRAQPMVAVDKNIAASVHMNVDGIFRNLSFSNIPFMATPLGTQILNLVQQRAEFTPQTISQLEQQVEEGQPTKGVTRVDVFGSYEIYQPVVYSSLFKPLRDAWHAKNAQHNEMTFGRRTRTLTGFSIFSDAERQALIRGWLIGRQMGLVRYPQLATPGTAEVYDLETNSWLSFPEDLYYPPSEFHPNFYDVEWLPSVLASSCIALLDWYGVNQQVVQTQALNPLRAYRALRRLHDTRDNLAQNFPAQSKKLLSQFIETGEGPLGPVKLAEGTTTREERRDAFVDACQRAIDKAYKPAFLTPQTAFQTVKTTREALSLPLVADLAQEIVEALAELIKLAKDAYDNPTYGTPGATPTPDTDHVQFDAFGF